MSRHLLLLPLSVLPAARAAAVVCSEVKSWAALVVVKSWAAAVLAVAAGWYGTVALIYNRHY